MAALEFFPATKIARASLSVILVIGLLSVLACAAGAATASNKGVANDASDVLRQYEGKIVAPRDLDSEVIEHLRITGDNESPGTVVADFNGDGIKDVALLTKEPDGTQLTLRVFLCKSECRQVSRVGLGEFEGLQYLTRIQPGATVKAAESLARSSQQLKHAAIRYWVFGRSNMVYFWNRKTGKLTSVTTGD